MKFRSGIVLIALLFSACWAFAQNEVDFQPKALKKTLQKSGIETLSGVQEMKITPQACNEINGKYFRITENNENAYRYIYIGRVNSCRAGGCSVTNALPPTLDSEYFDYYILFDEHKTVQAVKVYNYQATHGYEITAKGWLKQFIGFNGSDSLKVDKNIDAISGATISVYAITADVENKTALLKKLQL
ncbi:FMN-binding domain-containing protein [Draconibacterium orientale]|uniref:FMN-binding domain-containing protein n=1 Tax=Draconibacterium orientale TaxID=1168034 RepID=X5DTN6_9BACT|nr:FMN-binding protein [Draconibacterium orientale]AHW58535.1 FMN-binding protein [Draconibacterium orientale]SET88900.1 FMN-binding domain-containing protein [Draconibacterium orientale]